MKNNLIKILINCNFNKSLNDYMLIKDLLKVVESDKTSIKGTKEESGNIFIYLLHGYKFFSIMYTDNECLVFSFPNSVNVTHYIENDSYNIQYEEIKQLLIK